MTGFLSRLAEQAAGAAPAVRPRPVARFEPDARLGGGVELVELHEEVTRPVEYVRAPIDRSAARIEPRLQVPAVPRAVPADASPAPPGPAHAEAAGPAASGGAEVGAAKRADEPSVPAARGDPEIAPPTRRPAAAPERSTPGIFEHSVPREIADGSRDTEPAAVLPREEGILVPPTAVPPPARAPGEAPQKVVSPRRDPRPDPEDDATEITINIGRVEVRPPPAPPAPAPAPAPARAPGLGLDDYLRQRASGSRR